jgi:hypothetical protein
LPRRGEKPVAESLVAANSARADRGCVTRGSGRRLRWRRLLLTAGCAPAVARVAVMRFFAELASDLPLSEEFTS